jgi:predicted protein tyrosine phosphatase
MIHVCSLARLHRTVEDTGARHVITLLRDIEVPTPPRIAPENHLVLGMDDICDPIDGYTVPGDAHVRELVTFVQGWNRAAPIVVHCYAGISRSTAAAFVTACVLNPGRDEREIAWEIRRASRTAKPNTRIVSLADTLLRRDGRMIRAIELIGPGEAAYEGDPFRLDLA